MESLCEEDDDLAKSIVSLTKYFGFRNRYCAENNSKSNMRNKGIQYRECEKKNKSLNATQSYRDSDCSKEEEIDFIAFASKIEHTSVARTETS